MVIGGATLAFLGSLLIPPNPVVHSKRLSEWLRFYMPTSNAVLGSPQRLAADEALRSLGASAIPFLLHELQDSRLGLWCYMRLRRARLIEGRYISAADRKVAASRAFLALGPAASNAVPALIAIRQQSHSLDSQCAAIYALAWIGPSAEAAMPMLLGEALSANPRVSAGALWALGEIRAQPSLAVSVLTNALTSSNAWVQTCAAHALGNFGVSAWSAIPSLRAVTNTVATVNCDRSAEARAEALNAIRRIEAAEQEQADPLSILSVQ